MSKADTLSRIDKYTCKFENPVMEDQFMTKKYTRVKNVIRFALIFMSLLVAFDIYTNYNAFLLSGNFFHIKHSVFVPGHAETLL